MAEDEVPNVCGTCGAEGTAKHKLLLCTGCRHVKYCGRRCQRIDRKAHKSTCLAYNSKSKTGEELMARVKHDIRWVCNDDETHGFVYTYGIAATHPSKVEFISLNVARGEELDLADCFNFLAGRLLDGHDVRVGHTVKSGGVMYSVVDINAEIKWALLDDYATACAYDANLLLFVPNDRLPFTLPSRITLHKWRVPAKLLELALWRAKLNAPDREEETTRKHCRATCGADVIIPNVLPFLSGIDVGEKAEGLVVGERESMLANIRRKLSRQTSPDGGQLFFEHQIIYNAFNLHLSRKTSMQRGMLIRFLNGDGDDESPDNLAECTVYDALAHIDDWTTDWVRFLNDEEQRFVRENVELLKELYDFEGKRGR